MRFLGAERGSREARGHAAHRLAAGVSGCCGATARPPPLCSRPPRSPRRGAGGPSWPLLPRRCHATPPHHSPTPLAAHLWQTWSAPERAAVQRSKWVAGLQRLTVHAQHRLRTWPPADAEGGALQRPAAVVTCLGPALMGEGWLLRRAVACVCVLQAWRAARA